MKRFHEAPISCFEEVQCVTDGDYCLVHLLPNNEEYFNMFKKAVEDGREVILDNSVFELGEAFDIDVFVQWVKVLQPTYYVIPDVLNNAEATIANVKIFKEMYPDLQGKSIGVVQGNNVAEIEKCYRAIEPLVDKVAISMCYGFLHSDNSLESAAKNRRNLIMYLRDRGIINVNKPHHLLGVLLPQEMEYYKEGFEFIESVDTSNPVIHGMLGIRYTNEGLHEKSFIKMCDAINTKVTSDMLRDIMYNINAFAKFCGGTQL